MAKKFGLVLGSGGSRGVAHIGFLKALEEEGIVPDLITGCSMGSVVGSCYAIGMTPDEMYSEVKKLKMTDIMDLSVSPLRKGSLLRAVKLKKVLSRYLGNKKFLDTKIPFKAVAADLVSGEAVTLDGDVKLVDGVAASSTIPSIFQPVKLDGMVLVDGGVCCRVPVAPIWEMGAEAVVAVDVLGSVRVMNKEYNHNMFSIITRSIDIADGHLTAMKREKEKCDLWLEPDMGNMSQYKFKDFDLAYNAGYKIGKENAERIKKIIE